MQSILKWCNQKSKEPEANLSAFIYNLYLTAPVIYCAIICIHEWRNLSRKVNKTKVILDQKLLSFGAKMFFSVFVKHTAFSIPREKLIIAVFQLFFAQWGKRRALYLSNWMNSTYNEFHCNSEYIYIKKKKKTLRIIL